LVLHIRLECGARAAVFGHQPRGLLRRGEVAVDREHLRALLAEAQHGGAAVTHAFAGTLAGPDHDRDFSGNAHGEPRSIPTASLADFSAAPARLDLSGSPGFHSRWQRHCRCRPALGGTHARKPIAMSGWATAARVR